VNRYRLPRIFLRSFDLTFSAILRAASLQFTLTLSDPTLSISAFQRPHPKPECYSETDVYRRALLACVTDYLLPFRAAEDLCRSDDWELIDDVMWRQSTRLAHLHATHVARICLRASVNLPLYRASQSISALLPFTVTVTETKQQLSNCWDVRPMGSKSLQFSMDVRRPSIIVDSTNVGFFQFYGHRLSQYSLR